MAPILKAILPCTCTCALGRFFLGVRKNISVLATPLDCDAKACGFESSSDYRPKNALVVHLAVNSYPSGEG